jgi:hypothetical protein
MWQTQQAFEPIQPRSLRRVTWLSLVIALLVTAASLVSLLYPDRIYPTVAARQSFLPNDLVNLLLGVPALLGSMALAGRKKHPDAPVGRLNGRLTGLLLWPGALLYVTYNAIAYAVAFLLFWQGLFYGMLVLLSGAAVYGLVFMMDGEALRHALAGAVPERVAGGVLAGFGLLFFLRAVVTLALPAESGANLAVTVADLLITPLWVIGGFLLWRKRPIGYAAGAGLLFQASLLFAGLLLFFILQPSLAGTPFALEDFMVIFAMALACFIPFGMVVRGIRSL